MLQRLHFFQHDRFSTGMPVRKKLRYFFFTAIKMSVRATKRARTCGHADEAAEVEEVRRAGLAERRFELLPVQPRRVPHHLRVGDRARPGDLCFFSISELERICSNL